MAETRLWDSIPAWTDDDSEDEASYRNVAGDYVSREAYQDYQDADRY